jgi:hypothetical protein
MQKPGKVKNIHNFIKYYYSSNLTTLAQCVDEILHFTLLNFITN